MPKDSSTGSDSWCVDRIPVLDWLCWNACMRLLLPVFVLVSLTILAGEAVSGGFPALQAMAPGFFSSLLTLFLFSVLFIAFCLLLRGPDVLDCSVDRSGFHVDCYLPRPTALKLMARFRSPDLEAGEDGMVLISRRDVSWQNIRKIQLWPGRTTVLIFERGSYMILAVPCTPFSYEHVTDLIRSKLGKNQDVRMPQVLRPEGFREKLQALRGRQLAAEKKKLQKPKKKAGTGKAGGLKKFLLSNLKGSKHRKRKKKSNTAHRSGARTSGSSAKVNKPASVSVTEIMRMNAEDEAEARRRDNKQKAGR